MAKLDRSKTFSSILGAAKGEQGRGSREIPIADIRLNPSQPRRSFSSEALASLSESIKQRGILQPVLVREHENGYELVAGERRYRAAQLVGLESIPVTIRELSDQESLEVALIENLQREDLNPVEETDSTLRLLSVSLGMSDSEVLEAIRRSHYRALGRGDNNEVISSQIEAVEAIFNSIGRFTASSFYSHRLPILNMPEPLIQAVREGTLDYSKGRVLASIKDENLQAQLLDKVLEDGLSLKQLKTAVQEVKAPEANNKVRESVGWEDVKRKLTPSRVKKLSESKQKKLEKLLNEVFNLLGN